jgi:hypothetical protein
MVCGLAYLPKLIVPRWPQYSLLLLNTKCRYYKSGILTSHNPIGLHGLLQGIALLYGDGVCFL